MDAARPRLITASFLEVVGRPAPVDPRRQHAQLLIRKLTVQKAAPPEAAPTRQAPRPLPTVAPRRIFRSLCLRPGVSMTDIETDGHLNVPPFKKRPSFDGLKKLSVVYTTEQERLS